MARLGCEAGTWGLFGAGGVRLAPGDAVREGIVLQPLCVTVCHKGLLSVFEHSLKVLHLTRGI